MAYSIRAEGLDEKELEALDIEIGMTDDPAEEALEALRAHQAAQGMQFGDEAVAAPDDGTGWVDEEVR